MASKLPWMTMFIVGGFFIIAAIVGPNLYVPGSLVISGPHIVNAQNPPYWVDSFSIPPVRAGTFIQIEAQKGGPGNVTIVLESEKHPGQILPDILSYYLTNQTSSIDVRVPLEQSSGYNVYVITYNATYTAKFSGVWAQYYSLEIGLYWGILAIIAGVAMYYYYRGSRARELVYEQAMAEIKRSEEEKKKSQKG